MFGCVVKSTEPRVQLIDAALIFYFHDFQCIEKTWKICCILLTEEEGEVYYVLDVVVQLLTFQIVCDHKLDPIFFLIIKLD